MIQLNRLNLDVVLVNPDLIRLIEEKPDVTLTFLNGEKLVVKNSATEIVQKIIEFKKTFQIPQGLQL